MFRYYSSIISIGPNIHKDMTNSMSKWWSIRSECFGQEDEDSSLSQWCLGCCTITHKSRRQRNWERPRIRLSWPCIQQSKCNPIHRTPHLKGKCQVPTDEGGAVRHKSEQAHQMETAGSMCRSTASLRVSSLLSEWNPAEEDRSLLVSTFEIDGQRRLETCVGRSWWSRLPFCLLKREGGTDPALQEEHTKHCEIPPHEILRTRMSGK